MAIAEGSHLAPFRTQKLSPPAPMVLPWRRGGRVGRRRILFKKGRPHRAALFEYGLRILYRSRLPRFDSSSDLVQALPTRLTTKEMLAPSPRKRAKVTDDALGKLKRAHKESDETQLEGENLIGRVYGARLA